MKTRLLIITIMLSLAWSCTKDDMQSPSKLPTLDRSSLEQVVRSSSQFDQLVSVGAARSIAAAKNIQALGNEEKQSLKGFISKFKSYSDLNARATDSERRQFESIVSKIRNDVADPAPLQSLMSDLGRKYKFEMADLGQILGDAVTARRKESRSQLNGRTLLECPCEGVYMYVYSAYFGLYWLSGWGLADAMWMAGFQANYAEMGCLMACEP
jgi:hypothetical protein